jgi:hypothetical protein
VDSKYSETSGMDSLAHHTVFVLERSSLHHLLLLIHRRQHNTRFYVVQDTSVVKGNRSALPPQLTQNIGIISLPVLKPTEFYNNLEVGQLDPGHEAPISYVCLPCVRTWDACLPASILEAISQESNLLFILLTRLYTQPHDLNPSTPLPVHRLGVLLKPVFQCALSLQTGWIEGTTLFVDFPFPAFPENMGHWAEVLFPLYSLLSEGLWRGLIDSANGSGYVDTLFLANLRKQQLEVRQPHNTDPASSGQSSAPMLIPVACAAAPK